MRIFEVESTNVWASSSGTGHAATAARAFVGSSWDRRGGAGRHTVVIPICVQIGGNSTSPSATIVHKGEGSSLYFETELWQDDGGC